jgi:hypothetical protein
MLALLAACALAFPQDPAAPGDLVELRGIVLSLADDAALASRASVAGTMDYLYDHGVDVVFPVAWHDGAPMWPSVVAEKACGVEVDPKFVDPKFKSRDVLTEILVEAHRAGMEAVPIVDLMTICAAKDAAAKDAGSKGTPKDKPAALPDALDPKSQAFMLELLTDMVRIHEVDGLAFDAHGLARNAKLDDKGIAALGDWFQTLRAEIAKIDPAIRFVLVDGGAAQAPWMERGLFDLAVPRVAARDLDAWKKKVGALVAEPWCAKDPSHCAPLFAIEDGTWHAGTDFVIKALEHDRAVKLGGEVLSSLASLRAEEGKLGDELESGPYYGVAMLPWRKGEAWRTRTDAVPPKAGEGTWQWRVDSSGVPVLELAGGQKGDASWTLHSLEKGTYDLFVWIAPDADASKHMLFRTALLSTGSGAKVIDGTIERNKGWVYMGTVPMGRREAREVLRIDADEKDAAKVAVAGPLVGILSRRARTR